MSIENEKCTICGADLISTIENGSNIVKCTKCNWEVVSTYNGPEYDDDKTYQVFLLEDDASDLSKVKAVSKICGVNFIQAKEILKTKKTLVDEGLAYKIRGTVKAVRESNVKFCIEPEYEY